MNAETSEPTNQNEVDAKPAEQSIVKNGDQGPASKKDSTIDLPMIDLGEAVELVTTIHEKALETASMPEVAKACGYTSPSSTPFYRRAAAARLFKMLSPQKAELTSQALDYFKPDCEDAKQRSLESAVMGVPAYADARRGHNIISFVRLTFAVVILGSGSIALMLGMFLS